MNMAKLLSIPRLLRHISQVIDGGVIMKLRYLVAVMIIVAPEAAKADGGQIIQDVQSGTWLATHHTVDGGVHTDVCLAVTTNEKHTMFTLRADKKEVAIRILNNKWNLPSDLDQFINIESGDFQQEYRFLGLSSKMIYTHLEEVDAKPLLAALSKEESAELHFGKKVQIISLDGAVQAINSFRDCVRGLGVMDLGDPAGQTNSPF